MKLEGSCHCGRVQFTLESHEPVPYMRCYCSICRKTSGGGGYLINLGGDASSLEVSGREHTRVYRAMIERDGERVESEHRRHFCAHCGSHLWADNERWPELVHPVAAAIDTELPSAPEHVNIMVASKASWVPLEAGENFDGYPDQSLAAWHAARGLTA